MKTLLRISLLLFSIGAFAQSGPYVKVSFTANPSQLKVLLQNGLDFENLSKQNGKYVLEASQEELKLIKRFTSENEILINNLEDYYVNRANADRNTQQKSANTPPPGFSYGTLGSYLNYHEMVASLDSMRKRYPTLISVKASIGNTLENNPMYVVKISDHPDIEEPQEKQVLYDAMHHAREPQGMMQLIYFMWYILDRYEQNDPIVKYIIDHRELYFIPIVNPDGYLYNQLIEPNGGGMWRKNRSVNADGSSGVDLNRNYSYDWGYDDEGSSPFGTSNTFRGTGPFSEPETQNMRDFVNTKNFKSNLSYHCYGGYLIYPFGAKENYYTQDSDLFVLYADSLTKDNGYFYGTVFETLSYFANGGSCDWMYGDSSHSKILSFTPEVGFADDGFWPLPSRIVPLAEENIAPNLFLAKYGVNGLDVIVSDTIIVNKTNANININYFSAGLKDNSSIKSYLDFYGNQIVQANTDTFKNTSVGTFSSNPYSFDLVLDAGVQKDILPYRVVSIVNGLTQYDSAILILDRTTGIITKKSTTIKIYPNPSNRFITVDYPFKQNTIATVYNTEGKLVQESKNKTIDISKLPNGIYFLSITEGNVVVGIESFKKE